MSRPPGGYKNTQAIVSDRRLRARELQEEHDKRTIVEQLALIARRRGESKREVARLKNMLLKGLTRFKKSPESRKD